MKRRFLFEELCPMAYTLCFCIRKEKVKLVDPWLFGRNDAEAETAVLWTPHVKSWLTGKDSDGGRDWGTGGEGDDRGWDGWMASLTRWRWVWVNSGSWWWTGRPGVLRFMGLQRVGNDWATELNFPGGSVVKNPPANAGDADLIPGSGRFPGEGNGNPLQYSRVENPMNRGAWQATVHGVTKSEIHLNNETRTTWNTSLFFSASNPASASRLATHCVLTVLLAWASLQPVHYWRVGAKLCSSVIQPSM